MLVVVRLVFVEDEQVVRRFRYGRGWQLNVQRWFQVDFPLWLHGFYRADEGEFAFFVHGQGDAVLPEEHAEGGLVWRQHFFLKKKGEGRENVRFKKRELDLLSGEFLADFMEHWGRKKIDRHLEPILEAARDLPVINKLVQRPVQGFGKMVGQGLAHCAIRHEGDAGGDHFKKSKGQGHGDQAMEIAGPGEQPGKGDIRGDGAVGFGKNMQLGHAGRSL